MIWLRILAGAVAVTGVFAGIVAGAAGLICLIVFAAVGTEMFS